ncbi:hypothetical protein SOVF_202000 [Spinacia oleracea]|nr:hypothetical protein SOVF_202000 [Spinacia oleracea]
MSERVEERPTMAGDDHRAVFVDTNLDTHLAIHVSSRTTVNSLKRRLRREHYECFPDIGGIEVNYLLVKFNDSYYHLPDDMLLKTAFQGVVTAWFVSADVWTTGRPLEIQKAVEYKPYEPLSQPHIEFQRVERCPQFHNEHQHIESHPQHHNESQYIESRPQHDDEFRHVDPSTQSHVTLDMSCKTKRKKKKLKTMKKMNKKKNSEKENVQSMSGVKEDLKEEDLNEKTSDKGKLDVQTIDKDCTITNLDEPCEGQRDTAFVQPSLVLLKPGSDTNVRVFFGEVEVVHQVGGELSSKTQIDDQKAVDTSHIRGELPLPGDTSRLEESVKTISEIRKRKPRHRKAVSGKDSPMSPVKEQQVDEIQEKAVPVTVIQDKPKKRSLKKQPVPAADPSNLSVNQHLNETAMEMDAPKKDDAILTRCDMNDALLKSDNTSKKRKTNESEREREHTDTEEVSQLYHNNVTELSQNESLNLVKREKEIEEDVPSKSEHTAKRRKVKKTKSPVTENNDKPEESVETMSGIGSLKKRSQNGEADSKRVPPGSPLKEQPEEGVGERAVPKTVIQSDKPMKKSKKKEPVPGNQQLENTIKMDAPKSVEQADDIVADVERNDAQEHKETSQGEELHGEFSQDPRLEVSAVLAESMQQLEKPQASKQKARKLDQPSSIDTSSNGHNLVGSKKKKGTAKTSELQKSATDQNHDKTVPPLSTKEVNPTLAELTNSSRKTGVPRASLDDGSKSSEVLQSKARKIRDGAKAKEPSKKLEETPKKSSHLSTKETKRAIFENGNSSSSGEDGTDTSSSSATQPPADNLSSSEFSEGESKDSSKGNGRTKTNSSGLNLESVLRSSRSYKKAKLVASQLQNESQTPEIVPDSQVDM